MRRVALLGTLVLLAACGHDAPAPAPSRTLPRVCTTFFPTTYFARRIGGDRVEVVCPCPADADPIFWMPDADAIRTYQEADLVVLNGASYEQWATRVSLPDSKVVRTADPFRAEWITYEHAVEHSHGAAGKHAHRGIDGHTWMDPNNAKVQAREIEHALVRLLPQHAEEFGERYAALAADLDSLDEALRALGPPPRPIVASHPAYNYLARRYAWRVVNLGLDPRTVPADPVAIPGATHILWESEPSPEVAAAVPLAPIVFAPCETATDQDYIDAMRANIVRFAAACR